MRLLKGEVHKALLTSEIEVLKTFKRARNIIEVFDILNTKNNTYIVTEYCDGGDLSHLISGKRGMSEAEAIPLLKQIVDGYTEISANHIIHRDLKPANILLKDNKIKIADFGFAMRATDSRKYSSYNVGSPIYMPPEALNDNKYSYKSDIWAIGVIFYELLTGRTPWKAKTEKELGRQLLSVPISKLLPRGLSSTSAEFLERTLCISYDKRMNPDELSNFMSRFGANNTSNNRSSSQSKTSGFIRTSETGFDREERGRHDTSLNKNTINTPKNLRRFTFMNGNGTNPASTGLLEDNKNTSLPKTASTINNTRTCTTLEDGSRKQISKELLSQVHFCRFVYKLLQRINSKIDGDINGSLYESMCGLVFSKLGEVQNLKLLESMKASEYKKSSDFQKICQIVDQYHKKYEKEIGSDSLKWKGFDSFQSDLASQIKTMFSEVKETELESNKEKVIILDYLITLKQLAGLLAKDDIELFHSKSKIEAIVEGAPAKVITGEHVRAISAKMRAIKLI